MNRRTRLSLSAILLALAALLASTVGAGAFGNHPIGTGPFMLQSWQKGVKAVFVRNPYYFRAGKPYLDKVIVDVNVAPPPCRRCAALGVDDAGLQCPPA